MELYLWHEEDLGKRLNRMRISGGAAQRAAQEVQRIAGSVMLDESAPNVLHGRLTRYGESRIQDAFKYDLGAGYRLVCVRHGDVMLLVFAGKHDECDEWLDRNRGLQFDVDPKSKKLFASRTVDRRQGLPPRDFSIVYEPDRPLLSLLGPEAVSLLALSPADAARFGRITAETEDDEILGAVDGLEDGDLLLTVLLELRDKRVERAEASIRRARGLTRPASDAADLLQEAVDSSANSDRVVRLRDLTTDEIARFFSGERWRDWLTFLHPDQKPVAMGDFTGVALLRGVSGSGKTCVVLHRARYLAERYPGERIAVLTFNPALARLIGDLADTLMSPATRQRVDVMSIEELCLGVIRAFDPSLADSLRGSGHEELLEGAWIEAVTGGRTLLHPIVSSLRDTHALDALRYLRDELIWIRSAFADDKTVGSRLLKRSAYRDPEQAPRRGRAVAFSRDWRDRTLRALEVYEERVHECGVLDVEGLVLEAHRHIARLRAERPASLSFRAVLVDEVQDLGRVELELIRAIAPEGLENSLFFSGDFRQQVLPKEQGFKAAGIDVSHRKYFRKNYRNTRQILEAAVTLAQRLVPLEQLGEEGIDTLDPEYSIRDSARPLVVEARSEDEEIAYVARFLSSKRTSMEGPYCIAVCGLQEGDVRGSAALEAHLAAEGLAVRRLARDSVVDPRGVFLSAMETLKGFEFPLVVIMRCASATIPGPGCPREEEWREVLRLYVAMTRARDELILTHSGPTSRFLEETREHLLWSTVREQDPELSEELDDRREAERLRAENENLKRLERARVKLKVSEKGAVSLYGLGRFPVTLYKEQWLKLLDISDGLRTFLAEHDQNLSKRNE